MPGYTSEYDHYGNSPEFVEIAIPTGTDVSSYSVVIYGSDGYVDHVISLNGLTVQNVIHGNDIYVIESGTPGFSGVDSGDSTALVDDTGTVLQFITHSSAATAQDGAAAGGTSTYIGSASGAGNSLQSDNGGASYYVQSSTNPGVIPCFGLGTVIGTPTGLVAVEDLAPGDQVLTLDHGVKEVLWVRHDTEPLEGSVDDAKPVLIQAEALGPGRPTRDLIVSPQHRILVGTPGQLSQLFTSQVFVLAKALTALPCIRFMHGKTSIRWVHFALDTHEIIEANGCFAETLLLGPMVLNRLHQIERHSLARLINRSDDTWSALNGPLARRHLTLTHAQAIMLADMRRAA